jgi:hypothetical protein
MMKQVRGFLMQWQTICLAVFVLSLNSVAAAALNKSDIQFVPLVPHSQAVTTVAISPDGALAGYTKR